MRIGIGQDMPAIGMQRWVPRTLYSHTHHSQPSTIMVDLDDAETIICDPERA
jgi:hypothetical protein